MVGHRKNSIKRAVCDGHWICRWKNSEARTALMSGCMLGTSLAIRAALPIAVQSEIVDLDGPVLLGQDVSASTDLSRWNDDHYLRSLVSSFDQMDILTNEIAWVKACAIFLVSINLNWLILREFTAWWDWWIRYSAGIDKVIHVSVRWGHFLLSQNRQLKLYKKLLWYLMWNVNDYSSFNGFSYCDFIRCRIK